MNRVPYIRCITHFQSAKHEIVRQGNSYTETVKYLKSVVQKATYESLNFVFS